MKFRHWLLFSLEFFAILLKISESKGILVLGISMSIIQSLQPAERHRLIDLVQQAGLDVSDWSNYDGPPASNPKYCYEWAFVQGDRIVLNIWFESIQEENGIIVAEGNARDLKSASVGIRRNRADKFDQAVRQASKSSIPVRVIVGDGYRRNAEEGDTEASRVERRLLDAVAWAVDYDHSTGQYKLRRGVVNDFVDQFDLAIDPGEESPDKRAISGVAFVRNPQVRRLALVRANGKCEYCGQPGFQRPDGSVYQETHHIVPLAEGGPDTVANVAALCPNHHREAHHGIQAPEIREKLKERVSARV